jgi:hypothetical protein
VRSHFQLDREQEEELLKAIEEADRGDVIDADEFFQSLHRRR